MLIIFQGRKSYRINAMEEVLCVTILCQCVSCILCYKVPHKSHTLMECFSIVNLM